MTHSSILVIPRVSFKTVHHKLKYKNAKRYLVFTGCGNYTFPFNLVNFPAGVLPTRKITPEEEINDLNNFPQNNFMQSKLRQVS